MLRPLTPAQRQSIHEAREDKAVFRLRKRLSKLNAARPKKTPAGAGDETSGQNAIDAMREREHNRDLRMLMNQFEREGLIVAMSDDEIVALEALAARRIRGELPGKEWLAVLQGLKHRRSAMLEPPPPVRPRRNADGW